MVPKSVLIVTANGERLSCGGFSLDETIHIGSFEFIANYFGGLSLSPRGSDSGAAFMDSTQKGTPSPRRAMIVDSASQR
jgi:hypothetical protein